MSAERETVPERSTGDEEGLGDALRGDDCACRRVSGRHSLGGRDDVRLVTEASAAEPRAEPAKRTDRLVRDQQQVVAVADLSQPCEMRRFCDQRSAGVLYRL